MKDALLSFFCVVALSVAAQNPYLPLWEYIPDGEPYVFEDPDNAGQYRVYIYGSHDDLTYTYCGRDQVVWSAPADNLQDWRFDGIIFESIKDANGDNLNENGEGDILYAPDVALRTDKNGKKTYYLYPNNQARGRENMVAASDRPDGPFKVINWSNEDPKKVSGSLYFDPGVFVDDDGKAYAYWGYQESEGAELQDDMATIKPETYHKDMIPNFRQDTLFRFFEASSIRKIEDKYVFIYSRMTHPGDFGLPMSNYTLAYAYSDNPLGPFTYGGTLIDGRARGVNEQGEPIPTACPYGNTHGSLCLIGDQWWIFYHRQTGLDEFSRQAMVAPVTVEVEKGKGGKVTISEGEYTSEGFMISGLDPTQLTEAGRACYLTYPKGSSQSFPNFTFSGSYVKPTHPAEVIEGVSLCPVVNNTAGSVVGYRYFDMSKMPRKPHLVMSLIPAGIEGQIRVVMGQYPWSKDAQTIATIKLPAGATAEMTKVEVPCKAIRQHTGKQSLFFVFEAPGDRRQATGDRRQATDQSLCELYDFYFK